MKKRSIALFLALILCFQAPAYQLSGMENDLGHGLAGYAGTIFTYGFMKVFFFRGEKPNFEEKIMLHIMSTVVTSMVLGIKELQDDSKCRAVGNPKGCFDAGAFGYGMIGVGAANLSIIGFDF